MGRKTRTAAPSPIRSRVLAGLGLALGLGLLVLGILAIAKYTRDGLRQSDRFTIAFSEIDCSTPPDLDRSEFLAEVQYLRGLPDQLPLLDDNLAANLADAFAHHPWVEHVDRVSLVPPRKVEVRLSFRTPVLEVILSEGAQHSGSDPLDGSPVLDEYLLDPVWVVDRRGIVLPGRAFRDPLPILYTTARPSSAAGQPFGDASVEAAARLADCLRPHAGKFKIRVFEKTARGFALRTSAGSKVLWGQPPESESPGEATAAQKIERLLQYCEANGDLDKPAGHYEHDVRPIDRELRRPLPPAKSP
jgi:hypothetical protein